MQRVCPAPMRWNEVFEQLLRYAHTHACTPAQPPRPLILAGWWATNDVEKMRRWEETVEWAAANGCAALTEVADEDFYKVENPSSYQIGPLGGPCYRPWDYDSKQRPSAQELAKHLDHLSKGWPDIVGLALASITRPMTFSGKKARRLLVQADRTAHPPWGGWSWLSSEEQARRTFSRFRSVINNAVAPHEVDHVNFITEDERR
jgi:hypothetical protein